MEIVYSPTVKDNIDTAISNTEITSRKIDIIILSLKELNEFYYELKDTDFWYKDKELGFLNFRKIVEDDKFIYRDCLIRRQRETDD